MSPNTWRDWLHVGQERVYDANHLAPERPLAAVYVAGYALECALKAWLQRRGLPTPTSGPDGHNLKALWQATQYPLGDLCDATGDTSWFLHSWSTDLRYETTLPEGAVASRLVSASGNLFGKIKQRVLQAKGT